MGLETIGTLAEDPKFDSCGYRVTLRVRPSSPGLPVFTYRSEQPRIVAFCRHLRLDQQVVVRSMPDGQLASVDHVVAKRGVA